MVNTTVEPLLRGHPDERPPLLKGHFCGAKRVVSQEGSTELQTFYNFPLKFLKHSLIQFLSILIFNFNHYLFSISPFPSATGNHLKHNLLNQASSDSELNKHRAKPISNSLSNIANDVLYRKSHDKDSLMSSSKQGIFLPNVQNVKHNVTEKVAQVRASVPGVSLCIHIFTIINALPPPFPACLCNFSQI